MQQLLHARNRGTGTQNTKMAKPFSRFFRSFVLPALVLFSLPAAAQPVVSAVSPLVAPGLTTGVTISGSGFNATPANNIVYFGASRATVTGGTTTSLTVTVPIGTTYMPVSVTNGTTNLTGFSPQAFLENYVSPACASATNVINFDPHVDYLANSPSNGASGVRIADIDGDGKPDVIVGASGTSPGLYVYRNTTVAPGTFTAATFAPVVYIPTTGYNAYIVAVTDVDGDGKLDVAVGAQGGAFVNVLRNTSTIGSISFTGPTACTSPVGGVSLPYAVTFGDMDNDGKPDLLVAYNTGNIFVMFRNTSTVGAVSFAAGVSYATGANPNDIQVADLDGDGKREVVVACFTAGTVQVFRNLIAAPGAFGAGSLSAAVTFGAVQGVGSGPQCVLLGDMDGDGKIDIVAGTKNIPSRVQIFHNNIAAPGAFTVANFTTPPVSLNAWNIEGMDVGDFDGDGKPDIVVTNLADSTVSVFRNTSTAGTTSFNSQIRFFLNTVTANAGAAYVAAGDIDGDGLSDLAVTLYNVGKLAMLRNDPLRCIANHQVCQGDSVQFTEQALGGTWTSSAPGIGRADTLTGFVTGITAGTATISYNVPGGYATATVTVNAKPTAITGLPNGLEVCIGTITTLNGTPAGGTWTVQNANATVLSSILGTIQGNIPGTDSACYQVVPGASSCKLCAQLTINATPAPITGTLSVCAGGSTTQLTDASAPGFWVSSNAAAGTINSSNGLFTSGSVGSLTTTVTFSVTATTCMAAPVIVTVNPLPGTITGTLSMCQGQCSQLTDAGGGTWASGNTGVATVTAGGLVCGVNTGSLSAATATITYTLPTTGCFTVTTVTVNPNPAPITGTLTVCVGSTTALTDATGGGTWSSSNTANATIGSLTGIAQGVAGPSFPTITYALSAPTSCYTTAILTVNPLPGNINGTLSVCQGLTTQLTDATAGGTWSSSNPLVGSVSTTGLVQGLITVVTIAQTTTITYTLPTGCFVTAIVTVNPLPSVTTGNGPVCVGANITLCATPTTGAWTSSSIGVASVTAAGAGCGTVTGVAPGTANLTYTLPGTGCFNPAVAVVTVNPNPNPITGPTSVCVTFTTTLNSTTGGGTWTSSNTAVGTVDAVTGVVYGVSGGTTTLSYTLNTSCYVTKVVTVNALPTAIFGASFAVCQGSTKTLSDGTAGGTWSSSSVGTATVSAGPSATTTLGGVLTGLATGATSTITYTAGAGCYVTQEITVNPLPAAITAVTGTFTVYNQVCVGLTTQLSDVTAGGTWGVSNANATINSGTGLVTGVAAGTDIVTYQLATGCFDTAIITVNPLPSPTTGGPLNLCVGQTATLTATPAIGGVWSTCNTAIGTIGSTSGIFTGISAGTTCVSYTLLPTGCVYSVTAVATVNPLPGVITGTFTVCQGLSTQLTDAGGGTWGSSNTGIATVNASGVVTGVITGSTAAATVIITYTLPTGCSATAIVTVNPLPGTINGTKTVCEGLTTQLTDATAGGTWLSSTPANGSISTTGLVTGISGGGGFSTTNITYTLPTGCISSAIVTINANPTAINGGLIVCQGLCTTLTDGTGGGTWSSSNPGVGSINAGGVACGIITGSAVQGTTTITYTVGTGCIITAVLSVNPLPTPINGTLTVCQGLCTSLTDGTLGGVWSSSNPAIGTISGGGLACGLITGSSTQGTTTITYTLGSGCIVTAVLSVNPLPTSTTASPSLLICSTGTTTLSATPTGGTWSSGNIPVASVVSGTGVVTGGVAGTASMTYTLPVTGCYNPSLAVVTVNANPTPITGSLAVCVGLSTTLNSTPAGGVWSLANGNATNVGNVITGVNGSTTDVVTYSITATGCYTVATVSINPNPAAINGTLAVCQGLTTALSDGTTGGVWTTSNPGIASVSGGGVVTGNTCANTATITYTIPATGCLNSAVVTVNCNPSNILGNLTVCYGSTTTLSDATAGGTWLSGNTGVATISAGGVVTPGNPAGGTTTITYTLTSTGCIITAIVTVNPLPSAILGNAAVCQGSLTQLSDVTPFGTWSSSTPANGSVNTTGGVTGVICATTTTITYTLPTTCYVTRPVTINCNPAVITGTMNACVGLCSQLSDATAGGSWTSDNLSVATIGSGTGLFCGVNGTSTATISYTLPTTCYTTTVITINALPTPINGTLTVCQGQTTQLTDATPGGSWSSSNPGIGTISTTGIVTGIVTGSLAPATTTITYTLGTGCIITTVVTVNPNPLPIGGTLTVCYGLTTTLNDATFGGTWSSSNTFVATIVPGTGVATGQASSGGTSTITYQLSPSGCYTTAILTVNPLPNPITGPNSVCVGSTISLTDLTVGGTWSSSNTFAAVIDGSGNVTGAGVLSATTVTITYTLPTTCISTYVITVNPLPLAINGNVPVCIGATITLTDATLGGTWLSGSTGVATVGLGSGVVTGVAPGTTIITYTLPTSCSINTIVTVNPNPGAITGIPQVCVNATTQLSDPDAGGIWSSSNVAIGTVGVGTGVVFGVSTGAGTSGITTITYTLGTGCSTTINVTVNRIPAIPSGNFSICQGTCTTLTDATAGGTWSSSNVTNATIGSASGFACGVLGPTTATITYTLLTTGCFNTATITINPLPGVINGNLTVCVNSTTSLSDATAGGVWTSSNTAVGTVTPSTGVVTGVLAGTTIISYSLPTGCIITSIVTVNPVPAAITGSLNVCVGLTTALADPTPGGTWSSSNSSVGSDLGSGLILGNSAGTTTISYTLATGCAARVDVTVNPIPGPITGNTGLCLCTTSLLANGVGGGTWSSVSSGIATISTGGLVTASCTLSGTSTISYTLSTGCTSTTVVTVSPTPPPITGTFNICTSTCVNLTDLSAGGTWSSGNTGVATVDALGQACGVFPGTATITYTPPTGCVTTATVTVYPTPAAITPSPLEICQGLTISVSDITAGGTWGSSDPSIAVISASGVITGIAAGTALISYTVPSYCYAFEVVTVDALPEAITGNLNVCQGLTSALTDATAGGTWSSGNPLIATVDAAGVVTGLQIGTSVITYTSLTGSCITTAIVTVNPVPSSINGTTSVCVGATTSLSDASIGGTWLSGDVTVATIGTTGIVTAIAAGTSIITYTTAGGCITTTVVTVFPVPAAITGTLVVCQGLTTALTDATAGGTWSSSNGSATVNASGVVTGVTGGNTATITYTTAGGCFVTADVTINALPASINGTLVLCAGTTTALTDATPGGTWSSSPSATGTINATTGVFSGIAAGTANVTYTVSTGCITAAVVTVNPLPAPINGTLAVCVNSTTQLSDATIGGTWTSTNTIIATISTGGLVTGAAQGTSTISYTSGLGCSISAVVTVNPLPAPITGTLAVCAGSTTQLSDVTTGGTWIVTNSNASITSGTGLVSGITAGVDTVRYTITATGCSTFASVTINPLPATITGTLSVCVGLTTTLSDAATGGTWTSASTGIATIGSASGVVTGIATGTSVITYTLPTGCTITGVVTVNPNPTAVNGALVLCAGASAVLADGTLGGTWSSSNLSVATVDAITGIYTGVSGGTSTLTYTLPTGCIATAVVTVNPVPGTIIGALTVCEGTTSLLTDATPGGMWYSSIPPLASIGSTSGIVTGISAGTVFITYILPTGCLTTSVLTINPVPSPILGNLQVCVGLTTSLSDVTPGGTWSTVGGGNIAVSPTGVVTGLSAGTGVVTYMLSATGCIATATITVNPNPALITGTQTVCPGLTTQLSDATPLGHWISSNPFVASVGFATGLVSGSNAGTSIISYILPTGCLTAIVLTVNPLPTAILGSPVVCVGTTTTLSDATAGGSWSSSNASVGTVDAVTGVVTGIALGTTTITYTVNATGCYNTTTVTVKAFPTPITGNLNVCVGLTTALSDGIAGGTWSSSATAIGTIGSTSGVATGLNGGTTVITYAIANNCEVTAVLTVNPNPTAILGFASVCVGTCTSLSDLTPGGTWSSSDPTVATATVGTGVVCGVSQGVATITYMLNTGCIATVAVTVNPVLAAITGDSTVCVGSTISLSDVSAGGSWSSSNPGVGTISATGIVGGVSAGITTISYTIGSGCYQLRTVTVNALPNQFTVFGGGTYCQGGAGVPVYLDGSSVGVSYLLMYDSASTGFVAATGYIAGTGDTINFGNMTVASTYTVLATGTTSGCAIGMFGSATVTITPTTNPTVSLTTGVGDTVCPGTSVTLTPVTVGGGASPTYLWFVNGTAVSTSNTYTFIPADGDVVSVVMTGNGTCVFPLTASDTLTLRVLQQGVPLVNVSVDPGDTVCQFAAATFTATPTFGGTTPQYIWLVNNTVVGTGHIYTYVPATGDVVTVKMISNYQCRTADTAYGNVVTMSVVPLLLPHIDIVPIPGFSVHEDSLEMLTTVVHNAGPNPTYQWEINGVPVPGATNDSFWSNSFHDGDSITCLLTSSGFCDGITTFDWIYVTVIPTGIGNVQYVGVGDIRLMPNPNTGSFALKGTLSNTNDEELAIEVTDMLGQVVLRKKTRADHGKINEQIELSSSIANGMYILNVSSGSDNKSFHFVVER